MSQKVEMTEPISDEKVRELAEYWTRAEMITGKLLFELLERRQADTTAQRPCVGTATDQAFEAAAKCVEELMAHSPKHDRELIANAIRALKHGNTGKIPDFQKDQRVRVNHPRFHGEGTVQYDSGVRPRVVGVLLENGNVWEYEVETVTLLGT
jgi:hypothetical protein